MLLLVQRRHGHEECGRLLRFNLVLNASGLGRLGACGGQDRSGLVGWHECLRLILGLVSLLPQSETSQPLK